MHHTRPRIAAGVALVGASMLAAAPLTPISTAVRVDALPQIELTAANMVLDLVRHGQSVDNVEHILGTVPPGAPITEEGAAQAAYLADPTNPEHLAAPSFYDGVYASEFIRTQQTAAEWLTAAGSPETSVGILGGLNELHAGFLNDSEQSTINGLLYLVAPLAWMFGQYWVPQLGSTVDPNGMAFQDRFGDAVEAIYTNGGVVDEDGNLNAVAFSHGAAISIWTMMNVQNPDFGLFFETLTQGLLPNTGQVVIEGNPTDGWTLVSWNGTEVAENPGLLTGLFVDFRDLIVAPQMAGWSIMEALQGGDPTEIFAALQTGFTDVLTAFAEFPQAVIDTIFGSLGDTAGSSVGDTMGDMLAALAG